MRNKSMGEIISALRKERGMTQSELAAKMHVTDKAVSKWERNISYPDIDTISRLADVLDTTVDELLKTRKKAILRANNINELINISLIAIGVAMGICVVITTMLENLHPNTAIIMIGIGLSSIGLYLLKNKDNR